MAEHTQIHSRLDKCPGICAEVEVLSGHVAIGALGTACTTSSVAGGGIRLQKGGEVGSEQAEGAQPLLVDAIGGSWGSTELEERYEFFERSIYGTVQRADESHDSYLSRMEASFLELISRGTTLEEVQAYILLVDFAG